MGNIEDFAKLYRVDGIGQILVVLDTHRETAEPELKISITPPGLGVCSAGFSFSDDEAGWSLAEKAFKEMTEERAAQFARGSILKVLKLS